MSHTRVAPAFLFMHQENNFYLNEHSMHYLGSRLPNAVGHVEGDDERMPLEETGNMIVMVYALYRLNESDKLSYVYALRHFQTMGSVSDQLQPRP